VIVALFFPVAVQLPRVWKVTGLPEAPPVADTVKGASAYLWAGIALKEISCVRSLVGVAVAVVDGVAVTECVAVGVAEAVEVAEGEAVTVNVGVVVVVGVAVAVPVADGVTVAGNGVATPPLKKG